MAGIVSVAVTVTGGTVPVTSMGVGGTQGRSISGGTVAAGEGAGVTTPGGVYTGRVGGVVVTGVAG